MIELELTVSEQELRRCKRERIEPRLSRAYFCWVNVAVSTNPSWDLGAGTLSQLVAY